VLRISGDRRVQKPEDGKALVRSERAYGHFARSFSLPEGVDGSKAEASFKDGVLTIRVSKGPEPQKRTIEVKAA
jgi:HSP20 family protein